MNGAVIYRGPSMLDGRPIVAIVTGLTSQSSNAKTGVVRNRGRRRPGTR